MGVFCDRLKLCSTAAPDCWTGQNKGRYCEQERSFLLVSLVQTIRRQFHFKLNFSNWTDSRDCSLSKVDFSNLWSSNVNGLELPKLSVSCVGVKQEQQAAALVKLLDFKNPLTIYENMYKISQFHK